MGERTSITLVYKRFFSCMALASLKRLGTQLVVRGLPRHVSLELAQVTAYPSNREGSNGGSDRTIINGTSSVNVGSGGIGMMGPNQAVAAHCSESQRERP